MANQTPELYEKIPNQGNVRIRRIISRSSEIREEIFNRLEAALRSKFPVRGKTYTADISDIRSVPVELTHNQQKTVLLSKGNRTSGIYCDVHITDNETGKEVYTLKKHRILSVPYYTSRFTMIVDGNEYAVVSQMRTKSGVYTRRRGNDELESAFNLAKGANFKLIMNPDTGVFKIDMLGSTFNACALLKILGAQPSDIQQAIGQELYEKNVPSSNQRERVRNFLYRKVVMYKKDDEEDGSDANEKESKIRQYFASTEIDPETTNITLGAAHSAVSASTILLAMKKILAVYKGGEDVDERDHLEFQRVYSIEDLLKEVIDKNKDIVLKIRKFLDSFNPKASDADKKAKLGLNNSIFSQPVKRFLTSSTLSRIPSQINPIEFADTASIITRLGEGGITSERAVPFSTRGVTYSSAGLIDPIAAPESFKIGIDVHATVNAAKGSDNEFYKKVRNTKTGQIEYKRAIELYDKRVGFPDPSYLKNPKPLDKVYCTYRGKLDKCTRRELDYQIDKPYDLCTYTTNAIPFMPNNQGNRLLMGDKHIQQALPLEEPEQRLVKSVFDDSNTSSLSILGQFTQPSSPVDGKVVKIDDDFIHVKDSSGNVHKVDYENDLPLASKTFLSNKPVVKPGDSVRKGQLLAESNFSRGGEITTGRNLSVMYSGWKGLNHEDGIIVSSAAAKKMRSVHAEKVFLDVTKDTIVDKDKYVAAFPTNFTTEQLRNIDSNGVVKKGTQLHTGDPLILAMEKSLDSRINLILGKLNKALMHPYRDLAEIYEEEFDAEVSDVLVSPSIITVVLKVHRDLQVGDKLAGSYGNKGVCSQIIPVDQMPRNENGEPFDLILTSAGVISRINPAQIIESALGKISKKTGKTYNIKNFSIPDATEFVKRELEKNNVKEKETIFDPVTGKNIPGVFTGVQHFYKLFKTTDSNFAARGVGPGYDQDEMPAGSGEDKAKGMGQMEVNVLIAQNSRALLREGTALRGSKNAEFWRAFQAGMTPNFPAEKRTFDRFTATLKQAGVNVERQGNNLVASPLTDADIMKLSNGELKDAKRLDAKTLSPEENGLFDPKLFGGLKGDRWAHINLAEPVISPVFFDAARHVLGMTSKELETLYEEEGGAEVKRRLNSVDVQSELKKTEDMLRTGSLKGTELDNNVKKLKCLRALKEKDLKPGDAYVLSKFPVLPPIYRPITLGGNALMEADSNDLYRDLILQNNMFKEEKEAQLGKEDIRNARKALADSVNLITGKTSPNDIVSKNRNVKGALEFIAGDTPKTGYFQRKVISSKFDLTGRNTISPDVTLGLSEVGLPIESAFKLYKPFIIREMTRMGYSVADAEDAVEERNETATKILNYQMKSRPVVVNRAPSLHRHSMVAGYPVLREGKNLRINTIWEKGLNADYDGDAVNIHVPVTDEAVEDAKKLLATNQIFTDKKRDDLNMFFTNEPVAGLYKATENVGKPFFGTPKKYRNVDEAWKDFYAGKLKLTDYVQIG